MKYEVQFIIDAERDLNEIYDFVAAKDSEINAEKFIDKLIQKCFSLDKFPNRVHKVVELKNIDNKNYLEIHYKIYRIIYRVIEKVVFINCILDGRRNLQDLLHSRLLR